LSPATRSRSLWLVPVLLLAPVGARAPAPALPRQASLALCAKLPEALPDLARWLRSSAYGELEEPPRQIAYAVYAEDVHSGIYGVTHYRARFPGAAGRSVGMEGVQWILGAHARRFEVAGRGGDGRCTWRELEHGSPAYDAHMGPLLAVYGLHRQLLGAREGRAGPS